MWETTLEQQRNDPETLIYLNNARIGEDSAYSLAVPYQETRRLMLLEKSCGALLKHNSRLIVAVELTVSQLS